MRIRGKNRKKSKKKTRKRKRKIERKIREEKERQMLLILGFRIFKSWIFESILNGEIFSEKIFDVAFEED